MDQGFAQTPLALASLLDPDRLSRSLSKRQPPAPDGIVFRARTSADILDLFDLFNERSFLDNASTHGRFLSPDEFETWLDGMGSCGKYEVVAQAGSKVVGFGGLYTFGDQMDHCGSLMLGVREEWQQKRIGSTILHLLLTTAELMVGLRKVVLTVFEHNTRALHLYEEFGFEIEGRHRRFSRRSDGFVDAYSMALLFDPPEPLRQIA